MYIYVNYIVSESQFEKKIYAPVCLVWVKTPTPLICGFYTLLVTACFTVDVLSHCLLPPCVLLNYMSNICDREWRKKRIFWTDWTYRPYNNKFLVKIQAFPLFVDFLCQCDKHHRCRLNNNGEEGMFYCLSSFHFLQFRALTSSTRECKFSVTYKFRTSPN